MSTNELEKEMGSFSILADAFLKICTKTGKQVQGYGV